MPDLGDRLKEERTKKNLTQAAMADFLGIKRSTYSLYESGKREPNIETLQQMANVLETSLDKLIGWDKEKPVINNLENSPMAVHLTEDAIKNGFRKGIAKRVEKELNELSYDDVATFIAMYAKELTQDEKLRIIKILSDIE